MKTFLCDSCGHVLFFENHHCIRCNSWLGFSVEEARVLALGPPDASFRGGKPSSEAEPGPAHPALAPQGGPTHYRFCKNTLRYNACNWLIDASSGEDYCASCQLTEILPALVNEAVRQRWVRVETAKRRLLYTLYELGLPVRTRKSDPKLGLAFRFPEGSETHPVVTGHAGGIITMNIAEADNAFRENEREKLGEGYRTVLGHLRHEIGHYYWELFVRNDKRWLEKVRALFGDDRQSYQDAISRHYKAGPPANWSGTFISAYATMHPWEDWAETFAHYLHMVDTLETAQAYEMSLRSPSLDGVPRQMEMQVEVQPERGAIDLNDFEMIFRRWYSLTFVLNGLSRSMGMPDSYPFSFSNSVHDKLALVHEVIHAPRPAREFSAEQSQRSSGEPVEPTERRERQNETR